DCDLRPGIVSVDPRFEPGNQLHLVIDPALVHVVWVPQRTGRLISSQLHFGRSVISELAALGVVVDTEHVKEALAGGGVVLIERVEKPGKVILATMIRPIR